MVYVCIGLDSSSKDIFCYCLKIYFKNRAARVQVLLSINISCKERNRLTNPLYGLGKDEVQTEHACGAVFNALKDDASLGHKAHGVCISGGNPP